MKSKLFISLLFSLNFSFLWLASKENQNSWELSKEYSTYLSTVKDSSIYHNVINQNDYCSQVERYHLANPLSKVIFSDVSAKNNFKTELSSAYSFYSNEQPLKADNEAPPAQSLSPSLTMFYTFNPYWHLHHRISTHFLCESQLYNHVPSEENYKFSTSLARKPRSMYYFDLIRRTLPTYDLSDPEECKEFINIKPGYFVIKSTDKKENQVITPQTFELFTSDTKKGEKCPYANKYAQEYFRTFEFVLHCYAVWFAEPFKVFFTEGYAELDGMYEFVFTEKLVESYGTEAYQKILKEAQRTIWTYLKDSSKKALLHPRVFEVMHFKFVVDHENFPWFSEAKSFIFASYPNLEEIDKIYHRVHHSAIELAYNQILGLPISAGYENQFIQVY